ncbi:MAG: TRAP transporter large permease [Rhodospirillales bacterium]|nr:TRAP transporter large permease [Rhodospirillales bacterium]
MSSQLIGIFAMVGLFGMIMLRVPVAVALGVVGFIGYAAIDDIGRALIALSGAPYDLTDKYSFTVLPLFILLGAVASKSGMSAELYRAANAIFSGARGALAMGTVGACAGFGAISGSSLAAAATMARVAIPEMRKRGYSEALATGTVASAGTLGSLIPPSLILIIYAIIAEEGVPQLFAAAMIPGLIATALHLLVIYVLGRMRPEDLPRTEAMPWPERLAAMTGLWKILILFGIAVGGIYSGFMSPTEAAGVAGFVAIAISFATRSLSFKGLIDALLETVWTTASLFFIVIGAFLFAYFMALTQLPNAIRDGMVAMGAAPWVMMLIIIAFYIVLGFFLDAISMILITVPIFLPVATGAGYDGIWFGILVLLVTEVGLITPPVGLNIFVIRGQMPDVALSTVYRGILPFLWAHAAMIAILMLIPGVALWLPSVLY